MAVTWKAGEWLRGPFQSKLTDRLQRAATVGKETFDRLVPVDTRELKASGYTLVDPARKVVTIGATAGHALVVEFGSYKWPGKSYLRPAMYEAARVLAGRGTAEGAAGNLGGGRTRIGAGMARRLSR